MLTFNSKFEDELKKGKSDPATLVYLQNNIFFDEKTLQADWILNTSENNVDYTPSPPALGDVELLLPDTWDSTLADATNGRAYHSAIEYNGKIYIFGGRTPGYTDHVRIYDIAGDSWSNGTSGGGARGNHSAVEYNGKVYIFGGYNGVTNLNSVSIYDIAGDSWSSGTSGATIRQQHSAVVYNGKMYVHGGQHSGSIYNDLWEYDIIGDSWTALTSGGGSNGRNNHIAIAYNGKMYVHGGFNLVTAPLTTISEYDIIGDYWTALTSGPLRTGHSAIEYAGEIYIFGGSDDTTIVTNPEKYDPVSDTWFPLTDGSTLRTGHSAIEYLGKMYIFGGWNASIFLKDIWSHDMGYSSTGYITTNNFDLGSVPTLPGEWKIGDVVPTGTSLTYEAWSSATGLFNLWSQLNQAATARAGHSLVIDNGKIYIFGGVDDSGYLNDVLEYNISTKTFTQLSPSGTPPSARVGHTGIVYNGKMYIFGGLDISSYYNDLYELNLSTLTWSAPLITGGPPGVRYNHTAIEYSGKMYVFAGTTNASPFWFNDVWELDLTTFTWSLKSITGTAPTIRQGATAIEYSGKMYTFGGRQNPTYYNDLHELNLSTFVWTPKSPTGTPPSTRYGHIAVEYSGKMYTLGGQNASTYYDDAHALDLTAFSWATGPPIGTAPDNRSFHAAVLNNNEILIFGGAAGATKFDDLWSSGALNGDAVSLGTIVDGDSITDLEQYYRAKASFTSSSLRDKTPTLSSITADFAEYLKIEHSIGLTALTTTIDLFDESTISQMTVTLALNKVTSNWMATSKPRNKRVKIFVGFRAEGFTDDDFEKFYFGTVADANLTADDKVQIFVEGFAKDWKEDVPNVWEDSGDNVVWIDVHPIDVMLDIYRQYLPVRDSALLLSSFDDVKALTPGWIVTRTITADPIEGKKLLEELRKLMSCFFIPQPDGAVKIKRWDPSESAVASFTDTQLMSKNYKGNYKKIINRIYTYFNWAGTGDDAGDFNDVLPVTRPDSKDDYGKFETETVKDKWTQSAQLTQVEDRSTKLLDHYEDPPPLMPVVVDLKNLAIEEGDIVNMTTKRAPSTDMTGISVVRFQIVKKQINWLDKRLSWDVLAVTG